MSKISKGFVWSAIEQLCVRGGSFIIGIIIARLVAPKEYGLIAMLQVFISFCQLFIEGGFTKAIIQKLDRTEEDFNTIFIANFVIGTILYILLFLCAPLISKFYNNPLLTLPLRVLGIVIVIQSFSIIQQSKLTISLNFKTQARVSIIATLISGIVGIIYAYFGGGLWALISQALINQTILSIGLIFVNRWRPSLNFSVASFKSLFSYSSNELMGNILTTFYLNFTNLLIGKFYSPTSLSFYNRGFQMAFFPANILTNIITKISFPVLCEKQNKHEELIAKYLEFLNLSCYIVFPVMTVLAILSKDIIQVLLGDTWIASSKYVTIFAIVFALFPINMAMIQIIYVIGKPKINLRALILKRIISVIVLCLTIPFGVDAVAYGILAGTFIDVSISGIISSRELNINFFKQFVGLRKIFIGVLSIILLCFSLKFLQLSSIPLISLSVSGSCVIYLILTAILKMPQKEYLRFLFKKIYA